MSLRYGSDNPESAAFMRRVPAADRRATSRNSRKQVVAAVGATVLAGSALMAFQSSRASVSLRAETASAVPTTNLAANFDRSSYEVPTFLQNSPQIVAFTGDISSDFCMDDGGATKSSPGAMVSTKCKPTSVDQVFVFDDQNLMLRSAKKPDLCLSDGGAVNSGDGPVHMDVCDPNSDDQRFIYTEDDVHFKNPIKDLCLTNSGGEQDKPFTMATCDSSSSDQVFRILWQNEVGGPVDEYTEAASGEGSASQQGGSNGGSYFREEPSSSRADNSASSFSQSEYPGEDSGSSPMYSSSFSSPSESGQVGSASSSEFKPDTMPGYEVAGEPMQSENLNQPDEGMTPGDSGAMLSDGNNADNSVSQPEEPLAKTPQDNNDKDMPGYGGAGVPLQDEENYGETVVESPSQPEPAQPEVEYNEKDMPGYGDAGVPPQDEENYGETVVESPPQAAEPEPAQPEPAQASPDYTPDESTGGYGGAPAPPQEEQKDDESSSGSGR